MENYIKKLLEISVPIFKKETHAGLTRILSDHFKIL
jgi:hypothetical protein